MAMAPRNETRENRITQAIRSDDLDAVQRLVNKDNLIDEDLILFAFAHSNAQIFDYVLQYARVPLMSTGLKIVEFMSSNRKDARLIDEETLFVAYKALGDMGISTKNFVTHLFLNKKTGTLLKVMDVMLNDPSYQDRKKTSSFVDLAHDWTEFLIKAVEYGNCRVVHDGLKKGIDADLENLLITSVFVRKTPMIYLLLALGADPDRAIKKVEKDNTIEMDRAQNQRIFVIQGLERIKEDIAFYSQPQSKLTKEGVENLSLAELRAPHPVEVDYQTAQVNLMQIATTAHLFDLVIQKSISEKEDYLTIKDLTEVDPTTEASILEMLSRQGQFKKILTPNLWIGRSQDLEELITYYIPDFALEKYDKTYLNLTLKEVKMLEGLQNLTSKKAPPVLKRRHTKPTPPKPFK